MRQKLPNIGYPGRNDQIDRRRECQGELQLNDYTAVADPRSEKRGAPGDFLVNISQFRGLFEVFGENRGV